MYRILFLIIFGLVIISKTSAQSVVDKPNMKTDTSPSDSIHFTSLSASEYILDLLEMDDLWQPEGDMMKVSLARLIDHFNEPFDSVETRLSGFHYDSIKLEQMDFVHNDTLPLRWLNDSTLIIDTLALDREPFLIKQHFNRKAIDTLAVGFKHGVFFMEALLDTVMLDQDTITEIVIDTVFLESKKIQMHHRVRNRIIPPLLAPNSTRGIRFLPDSSKIIISDTTRAIVAAGESPFYIVPNEKMPDSLRVAVETLLSYTANRDSVLVFFNDIQGKKTPFWLTKGKSDLYRYWVRNYKNDSITIWMGNPSKHEITLILEEDVNLNRIAKETVENIPITLAKPERSLAKVEPLKEIPVYWDYELSSSFALSQTFLSYWAKGGENSLTSVIDIKGTAKYTDTEAKIQWTNSGRLNYGSIITEENGLRTNTDMLEFNSQYNKVLKEKIDFSAVFYMKNQIARGYNYPNDSVIVSKFLNPGTFTVGLGLEYKPFKKTSLNFSPLSYKNTFVLDPANIDQTAHGIAAGKRVRQEMGGQLVIKNSLSILDDLNISNSVRLFSGYLNKPENIDVDWEINLDKRINWFATIRLNLHMIYDDDIRFPVLDDNDQPVLLPDGSAKKVPKLQFKEFLGLSFLFKF